MNKEYMEETGIDEGVEVVESQDEKSEDTVEELSEEERKAKAREQRRKRRLRSQFIAYVGLLAVVVLVFGGIFGIFATLFHKVSGGEQLEQAQAQIEEMTEQEEEIIISQPEVVEIELTEEEKLDQLVDACIEVMSLEDKVAGLFFVTPEELTDVNVATRAGEGTLQALNQYAVGGIFYQPKNIIDETQFREMLTSTNEWSKYPLFIGVEEEGGANSTIARSNILIEETSASPSIIADTGDPQVSYDANQITAKYLNAFGFNINFAPVCDVLMDENNSFLKNRSYGTNQDIVAGLIASAVTAMEEQGVHTCLKHFPGIGELKQDTSEGMIVSRRTLQHYKDKDFVVFKAGIDAGATMVMVSNVSVPAITGNNTPCSMSKEIVTDQLRTELGFEGIIITDSLNDIAITEYYEADEAAILALKAGCDMIFMPGDFKTAYNGVLEAVKNGTIAQERINDSLRRIYRVKYNNQVVE